MTWFQILTLKVFKSYDAWNKTGKKYQWCMQRQKNCKGSQKQESLVEETENGGT